MNETPADRLALAWEHEGTRCTLDVDLETRRARIIYQENEAGASSFQL